MDSALHERLTKIQKQIEKLRTVEEQFLYLDAHKKVLFSSLFIKSVGKNNADKEANAYTSEEWKDFIVGHATTEAEYLKEKRTLELKLKAFDAAYLSLKVDQTAIKKHGSIT